MEARSQLGFSPNLRGTLIAVSPVTFWEHCNLESKAMTKLLRLFVWCGLLAFVIHASPVRAGEAEGPVVPLVQVRTESYRDVTLVSRTPTHLFVRHSRGVATIRVADVSVDVIRQLSDPNYSSSSASGASPAPEAAAADPVSGANPPASSSKARWISKLSNLFNSVRTGAQAHFSSGVVPRMTLGAIKRLIFLLVIVHLFMSYCAKLICQKAGAEPGPLVWLPILQIIPLLRAARMSRWWFLSSVVPVLNLVALVMWCVKIADARGKGILTAIMLLLPVTGFFAILYLAFSDRTSSDEDGAPGELDPWQRHFSEAM
jgi:hypothetical protein